MWGYLEHPVYFSMKIEKSIHEDEFLKDHSRYCLFYFATKTIFSQQKKNILFKFLEGNFLGTF